MRKTLFAVAGSFALICFALGAFFFVKYKTPDAFPVRVAGLGRVEGPTYRTELGCEDCKKFYAAAYSHGRYKSNGATQVEGEPVVVLTVRVESSAAEAKTLVRQSREAIIKAQQRVTNSGREPDASTPTFVEGDNPAADVLVYTRNGHATMIWASDNWSCSVFGLGDIKTPDEGGGYDAEGVLQFVSDLSYAPKDHLKDHAKSENLPSYSIFLFFPDVSTWLGYWYPVLIPLIFSVPALLVMAFMLIKPRKVIPLTLP